MKEWLKEQKQYKGFYALLAVMVLLTAALLAEYILVLEYGALKIIRWVILLWGLFLVAWIDGHQKIIPNRILLVMFGLRTILLMAECIVYSDQWMTFITSCAIGALAAGGMFLVCYFITRGSMGAGDVKLMTLLGYYVGSRFIFGTIFLIVVIAAVVNIVLLLMKKVNMKQTVPFAPFVLAGTVVMLGLGI